MKSIGKNLEFIKKNKVKITIEGRHMPGGAEHNLICWICGIKPAVYSMYPNWMFLPCWRCQSNIKTEGVWNRLKKPWWKFWSVI